MTFGESLYKIVSHYSQFYFVAIASILGTGILGLPVTLSDSGFRPFIISFLICYFVQVLTIFFFTEVLQKAYYRNVENLQLSDKDNAPIHMEKDELPTYGSDYDLAARQAHFWDSTINYKSTLYSKYCLIFGLFLIYFLSSLFLSIHITMGGDNPLIINICKSIKPKKFFFQYNDNETSLIPTKILYLLFILLNLLTLTWIYTSYKDIFKLKRKCLATVFFYSLVLTKFQEHERSNMVNQSLKRLLYVSLFVLSNIISILPGLTIKSLNITLNIYFRIFFIYLTILPWCESVTFLFFNEMKFRFIKKKFITKKNPDLQQRIGTQYGEFVELRDMVVPSRGDVESSVPLMLNDNGDHDITTTMKYYARQSNKVDTIKQCLPNLHSLGELLLPCFLRQLFTLTVLLSLLCLLVSYALAGSQAFTTLFHVNYIKMIPVFCWTWTFVIIFLHSFIQPIISVLTFLKGTLFTGTVVVTLLVGLKVQNPVTNDYKAIGDSFLMSTIALGGLMNVMPLMFSKLKQTRDEIIGFNVALFLGLTTCVILNILWCWSILAIVPQRSTCLSNNLNESIQMVFNLLNESQIKGQCIYSPSLQRAELNGEISTVPLSKILETDDYKFFQYVSFIVQLFIVISISVSFMTMGSALHHTIKGVVDSFWNPTIEAETSLTKYGNIFQYITVRRIIQCIFSLIIFSIVFGIAMSNPKGFKSILEQAGSLFQNIEMGIFLAIMIYKVTATEYRRYVLPFQLPQWFITFQWIIPIYFGFAVIYDIYHIVWHYLK
ncbi:unnamed protein product [Rotaria sordida]|uniref:Uncharacterized protein n=1 Tax=Rotaria sordida TaxID=392033 RepID=A0A814AX92_9BILA|nr:unnamed protein product [Rotaria sordida]